MSRAVRRQQRTQPKEGQASAKPPSISTKGSLQRGARGPTAGKRRFGVPRWLEDIVSELRKVTWPTREETTYLTMVVVVVAVTIGVILGSVDVFFNWLIDRLLLR